MLIDYFLLLLPALALARIDVDISVKFNITNPKIVVAFSGADVAVISDTERSTFKLNDGNLKDAVQANFGKRPDDAYVRSPTPWGDLYSNYGWQQVTRTLTPRNYTILGIQSQPTIIMEQFLQNNSSKSANFSVELSQKLANTATSSWSTGGSLTIGQEIKYGVNIEADAGGLITFSYTNSWGKNTEKSQPVTFGSSTIEDLLKPGQSVVARQQATKGTIKIEVEYESSLSGRTAINYSSSYKGHHFWGSGIEDVMCNGNISNSIISREVIEIGFYANYRVLVQDRRNLRHTLLTAAV